MLRSHPLTMPNHQKGQELSAPITATPVAASNYFCKKKQKCMPGLWLSKSWPRQKQAINCSVVLVVESGQTSILYTAACITVVLASGCGVQEPTIPLVLNILCDGLHLIAVDDSRKVDLIKNSDILSNFCKIFLAFCRNDLDIKILKMKSTLSLVLFHLRSLESCLAS